MIIARSGLGKPERSRDNSGTIERKGISEEAKNNISKNIKERRNVESHRQTRKKWKQKKNE